MEGVYEPRFDDQLSPPARKRRLTDKILVSFHQACDQGDLESARALLAIVEKLLFRPIALPRDNLRKNRESLVAAYERLWMLQHPEKRDD